MWTEPPSVICSLRFSQYQPPLTGAELAELVKRVIEARDSQGFVAAYGYFDGDTVSFGQTSSYDAYAHIRVVPALEGSPFFGCDKPYDDTIYFVSHHWAGTDMLSSRDRDMSPQDVRRIRIAAVKQLVADVEKEFLFQSE